MKLSDVKARVWDRLDEDPSDPQRYPEELIVTFLREAVEQWSLAVGGDRATQTITLVADQLSYALAATASSAYYNRAHHTRIISVIDDTTDIPLVPASWRELYDSQGYGHNRRWRNVRTTRPTHYVPFSFDRIWLWPAMGSVSGETVTVTFDQAIDDAFFATSYVSVDDTRIPAVPAEYHHLLVDVVVARCKMIGARGAVLQRCMEFLKRWSEAIESINARRSPVGHTFARSQGSIVGR